MLVAALSAEGCGTDDPGNGTIADAETGADATDADATDAARAPDVDAAAPPPSAEHVGAQCRTDEDCGGSLRCLAATADDLAPGLGGPPHGMCSKACIFEEDCDGPVDAFCGSPFNGGPPFCLPTCEPGGPAASKCSGRLDFACQTTSDSPTGAACVPACGGAHDCGGRRCDLATGMCTDGARPGLPLGANCLVGPCADGFCLELDGVPVCSGSCRLGSPGCGFDPRSPDRLEAYCLYGETPSSTEGDLGLCATLCDCDSDCLHEDFVCEPGPPDSPIVLSVRGRRGACTPAIVAREHLDCSGDAGIAEAGIPEASIPEAGGHDASIPDAGMP